MSEEKGFFSGWLKPKKTPTPSVDTKRARGLGGAIESYANRRSAERMASEMDAAATVYRAATSLDEAREIWHTTKLRLAPANLRLIEHAVEMEVHAEHREMELRLAEAEKKKRLFERRFELEELELDTDLMRAKKANQEAREALYGGEKTEANETSEEKRLRLIKRLSELEAEIESVLAEWEAAKKDGEPDEATSTRLQGKFNSLMEERERLQTELDSL